MKLDKLTLIFVVIMVLMACGYNLYRIGFNNGYSEGFEEGDIIYVGDEVSVCWHEQFNNDTGLYSYNYDCNGDFIEIEIIYEYSQFELVDWSLSGSNPINY